MTTARFTGRVCLVTGAAGGIGSAITRRLVDEGGTVVAVDRDGPGLERLAGEVPEASDDGPGMLPHLADLALPDAPAASVEATVGRFGRLDVLCNNHALTEPEVILRDRDLVSTPPEVWDRTLAVNLLAPVALCRAAIPHMRAAGAGAIVNVVSVSGLTGDLVYTAYGASKAALVSVTQYVATQYGRDGIRANAVAPGMVVTPGAYNKLTQEDLDLMTASNLVDRLGRPEDIAATVAFLASDDAAYVTGEVVRADGGQGSHISTYASLRDR